MVNIVPQGPDSAEGWLRPATFHEALKVSAGDTGNDQKYDQYRYEGEDRHSDNASDDSADGLRATGVARWLGVDFLAHPAPDDDATDAHQSTDDAGQSQDSAQDAEDQRQGGLWVLLRRRDLRRRSVRRHRAKGRLIRVGLIESAFIAGWLSVAVAKITVRWRRL